MEFSPLLLRTACLVVLFGTAMTAVSQTREAVPLPASTNAVAGINLDSGPGKKFVGNQLRAFSVESDGAIRAGRDAQINLYYTEGAPFRLSGKVWLGGASKTLAFPADLPDGFALFLREWDSLHRYSLTSRSLITKRRLHNGIKEPKIAQEAKFEAPGTGQWISFSVEATPDQISFQFGGQSAVIKGPLDMDGANKIVLAAGAKIKDVQLEILEANAETDSLKIAPSAAGTSVTQAASALATVAVAREANGKVALSFHTVPGQTYRLRYKNDLTDPTWTPLGGPMTGTGTTVVIPSDASQPRRFYNVQVGP